MPSGQFQREASLTTQGSGAIGGRGQAGGQAAALTPRASGETAAPRSLEEGHREPLRGGRESRAPSANRTNCAFYIKKLTVAVSARLVNVYRPLSKLLSRILLGLILTLNSPSLLFRHIGI